jgi:Homeodomain-like domain
MPLPRGPRSAPLPLTGRQRTILEEMIHSCRRPHDEVQRATLIVQRADGARTRHLAEVLGISDPTVLLWRPHWTHAGPALPYREWPPQRRPMRRRTADCSNRSGGMRRTVAARPR